MPTVTEQRLSGFAHCEDSLCDGNTQRPADVVCTLVQHTFVELGGDFPGFEKSNEYVTFADPADQVCPVCSGPRSAAVQQRPTYPTSQYAQDGLLKLIKEGMVKPMGEMAAQRGGEIDELKAQVAELRELLAEKANKPGRKPVSEPRDEAA